jgi:hypothetical protein
MTGDEMEVEAHISEILDRLGREMQQAATRLRFAPYCAVEEFISRARGLLKEVAVAGEMSKGGQLKAALTVCKLIEIPEIEVQEE